MNSTKPLYLLIVDQFKTLIDKGVYKVGDKIPSVREYALAIKVNPNTVAKAYDQLKSEGIVRSFPQKGIFIIKGKDEDRREFILKEKLREIYSLEYKKDEVIQMVEKLWK